MTVRSRNRVRISGRPGALVVVLAHGFGRDQNMWRLVVPALEEGDLRCLAVTTQAAADDCQHCGAGGDLVPVQYELAVWHGKMPWTAMPLPLGPDSVIVALSMSLLLGS